MTPWSTVRGRLEEAGLGPFGVADASAGGPPDPFLPGARRVLIVASGARAWRPFLESLPPVPGPNPFDTWAMRCIAAADPDPGRVWLSAGAPTAGVDLRTLLIAAGLGWPSRLGVVLHPELGPWMGLRAIGFTHEELPIDGPRPGGGPCSGCSAPCVAACPASAFRPDWDAAACLTHRALGPPCDAACASRRACPVGMPYEPAQEAWHCDPRPERWARPS